MSADALAPMTPETLSGILATDPYPGCVVTVADGAARLNIGEHVLLYRTNGWHYGKYHFEGLLSEYGAPETVHPETVHPETVHPEIRRALKVALALTVEGALGDAENVRGEDPIDYLTDLCANKMLAILDVAVIADARKDEIGRLAADLAAKDAALKTAHAALTRICEVIGAPAPVTPTDAVEAVKAQLGADSDAELRAGRAEAELKAIAIALDDAGAPQVYQLDKGARMIPAPERVRILGDRWRAEHEEWYCESATAARCLDVIRDASQALDDWGAPRHADTLTLSLAARIRALR